MIRFLFQPFTNQISFSFFLTAFLAAIFVFPMLTQAQEDVLILPDENAAESEAGPTELYLPDEQKVEAAKVGFEPYYDAWKNFQSAVEGGDSNSAYTALGRLLDLKIQNDVAGFPEFAQAAVQEGNHKMNRRNPEKALSYYRAAVALDPALADGYYGEARAYFAQGIRQYANGITAAIQGFLAPRTSFNGRIYFYSKLVLIGLITLIASAAIYALILFLKYNRLLRHDAEEKFIPKLEPRTSHLLIWILLSLPILLFLGPLWLVPFWLMIFAPYGRAKERVLAILFLIVFIVAFPLYRGIAKFADAASDPVVVSYSNAISAAPNPKIILDFERYVSEHPADNDARLMLASLYKSNGLNEQAAEVLQRMMLDVPADSRAPNNLAVIYFRQGETEYAVRLTQKAIQLNPRNAIYKYNLSTMFRAKFNFAQAQKLIDEAKAADPALFKDGEPVKTLLDVVPNSDYLKSRIDGKFGDPRELFVTPFSIVAAAFFFIALILFSRIRPEFHSHRCAKCGRAFCRKCQTMDRSYGFCTQCLHIFVKKDGVSPASRREKMSEIDGYSRQQRWLRILSSILVPGSADLYDDHVLTGIITMTFWFLCLTTAIFTLRIAPLSTFESIENASPVIVLCIAVMAIVFIIALLRLFRRLRTE